METKEKKSAIGKKLIISLCVVLVLLILVYISFAVYYRTHFLPNTKINQYTCDNKTAEAVARMVAKETESYALAIQESGGGIEMIYAADIDLHVELGETPESVLGQQNEWLWLFKMFGENSVETEASLRYDEAKCTAKVDSLKCMTPAETRAPEDAYIEMQDGKYVIVDAKDGSAIDRDKMQKVIADSILSGETMINLSTLDVYEKATIQADNPDLLAQLENLNAFAGFTITIPFGEEKETIAGADIQSWLTKDEKTGLNVVSYDKVEDYVIETLATKYNTFGSGIPRTFTTNSGKTISISGGDYGWWLDYEETALQLKAAIEAGKDATVEPVWLQTADQFGEQDFGDTYIELDLSRQHMWLYQDGEEIFDAKVTTGNVRAGFGTPTGTFRVMYKTTQARLTGEGYSELVDYFVVFTTNTGFHDAKWQAQDKFGTDYYINSGSHGCVRMLLSDAEKLYDLAETGMPVFVY